jgi:hypothetical protein
MGGGPPWARSLAKTINIDPSAAAPVTILKADIAVLHVKGNRPLADEVLATIRPASKVV